MEKENAEKTIEILKKAFDGVATFNAKVIDIEADSLDEALKKIKIEMISSMKKKNKQDNADCDCLICEVKRMIYKEAEIQFESKNSDIVKECIEYFEENKSEIIQYEEKLNEAFFTKLDDILKSYVSHVIIGKLIQEYKK